MSFWIHKSVSVSAAFLGSKTKKNLVDSDFLTNFFHKILQKNDCTEAAVELKVF